MSARADDHRALLTAARAPAGRREVIGHDLNRVQQVIEILNLRDRPQPAQRGTDRLADDRAFANSGVGHTKLSVFFLKAGATLIDVAEFSDVFAEDDDARIAPQRLIETWIDDLESVGHQP